MKGCVRGCVENDVCLFLFVCLLSMPVKQGIDRPVGSGAAWRRSPHQNSAGREREKEEKGEKERKKRGKKRERRKRKEWERRAREQDVFFRPMGVKHPLGTIHRLLKTRKNGG